MVIDSVKQILAEFKPAGWHKDLVDAGFVREIINQGQGLTIRLVLPFALSPANSTGLFPCAAVSSSKELPLSAVLAEFPVNVLIQQS